MRSIENTHSGLAGQIVHGENPTCKKCDTEEIETLRDGLINISVRCCHRPPECNPVVVNLLTNPVDRLGQEVYVRKLCACSPDLPLQRLIRTGRFVTERNGEVSYIVKEYKPGDTLHSILANSESLGISDKELSQMLFQLGSYLSMMHQIKLPVFGKITGQGIVGPQENCSWADCYFFRLKRMFDSISAVNPEKKIGNLAAKEVQSILPELAEHVNKFSGLLDQVSKPKFVHHDFHFLNIIADKQDSGWLVTGILDTENATAGDPAADLVSMESHLFLSQDQYRGVFRKNIKGFREGYIQQSSPPPNYPRRRTLYHIPWSLSYFEAILNMDTRNHPMTPQIIKYANRHHSILKELADGKSLQEIGVFSIF